MSSSPSPYQPPQPGPPPASSWTTPSVQSAAPFPQAPPFVRDAEPYLPAAPVPWWAGPPPEGDPGTIDLPWYGIGPVAAVRRAYAKAFRYDGRASRGEYWWFALFEVLVMIALYVAVIIPLALTTGPGSVQDGPSEGLMVVLVGVMLLTGLQFFLVGLALTIRRLHDSDMSGWMYLLTLIPYIGGIVLLVLVSQSPKLAGMRFDRGYQHWQIEASYGLAQAPYGYPQAPGGPYV